MRCSGDVDGTRPTDEEIGALNLALIFAALEGNPRRTEDTRRNPWSMMTTDNAELHVWPVDVEDGDVTVTSGGIIRTISAGYKIADEQLIIRPPRELFMPMGTCGLKADVLEAVYKVALDAPSAKGRRRKFGPRSSGSARRGGTRSALPGPNALCISRLDSRR